MADPILEQQEQQDIRSKLIRRILVAAVLVTAIGITIPLLDRLPAAPEVVQSNPTISPLQATTPPKLEDKTKDLPEQPQVPEAVTESDHAASPKDETPAVSTESAQPNQPPAPPKEAGPQQTAVNSLPTHQPETTKPANTTPASAHGKATPSLAPVTATALPTVKPNNPMPPATSVTAAPTKQASGKPIQPIEKQTSMVFAQPPQPQMPPQTFNVQAGVFINSNNAEKLLSQLKSAGIPAFLETRVQVGPFRNRAEAEIAAIKLRELGITPVISQNPH